MTDQDNIRVRTLTKYKELNEQLRDFLKNILLFEKSSSLNEQISSNINDTGGISLLATKNDLLLQYLMNLVAVMYRRSTPNHSLNSPSTRSLILRLCEIRTYIEKIRPIEQKLQYQIDKLLKTSLDQQLNYRANINNFDEDINEEKEEDEDEEEGNEDEREKQGKIYRPPKLVPVEYNDDLDKKNDKGTIDKRLEHLKRRAYHSDILDDYKNKYSDAPEEVYNSERSRFLQQNRSYKEKIAYEEDYMKRLPQTKRERAQLQRSMSKNGNDVMDHIHDADVLFDENTNGMSKKKKGKMSRQTKKRVVKKKQKSVKRLKSRK
jgi:U3 small nucleolar ribonucleoprotein protein LCP5